MAERFVVDFQASPDFAVVAEGFFATRQRLEDMIEPMTDAANVVSDAIKQRFDDQDFVELSPNTHKTMGRFGDEFILVDTGAMYDAATSLQAWDIQNANGQASAFYDPSYLANIAPYFRFHISGTRYMPERNFLEIDEAAAEAEIDGIFQRFVDQAVASA